MSSGKGRCRRGPCTAQTATGAGETDPVWTLPETEPSLPIQKSYRIDSSIDPHFAGCASAETPDGRSAELEINPDWNLSRLSIGAAGLHSHRIGDGILM